MKRNYQNPAAENWYREMIKNPAMFPFAFTYGGTEYRGFSQDQMELLSCRTIDGGHADAETTQFVYRLKLEEKKAELNIQVTLVFTFYPSHGVSEWTVWFENTGDETSGVLENVYTQMVLEGEKPILRGILGDHDNQYRSYARDLSQEEVHFISDSGRATHGNFPYFNLEYGEGGAMLVIGWGGTWSADFETDGNQTVYTARSVNGLCTCLKPGEKIRTALFVYAPYTVRNEYYATNFWRSWFVECNLPPADAAGTRIEPFSTSCLSNDTGLPNSDGSISERYYTWKPTLEKMAEVGVRTDIRWFDAGWYVAPDLSSPEKDWWGTVGTWELDPVKWPGKTFLESTEYARERGMRTLMWFEPERVTDVPSLVRNFGYDPSWAIYLEGSDAISNNIGIPECFDWTVERICKVLRENKVEIYREDNNSDPGRLWKHLDSMEGKNRTGITECRFIDAHYRMWDAFIECTLGHGGCGFVDSCASGGGRNDLESLRRGIPFLRSDADRTTTALRLSMTTSFNKWVPFCGANTKEKAGELDATGRSDVYTWRASYLPALNVDSQFTQDPDQDFSILRFGLEEWAKVKPYLLKEFYVLTPWHDKTQKDGFTAYCFWDAEEEKGVLFLFRMEECEEDILKVSLPIAELVGRDSARMIAAEDDGNSARMSTVEDSLKPADRLTETYFLRDEDSAEEWLAEARELKTLEFALPEKRSSRLVWIQKAE